MDMCVYACEIWCLWRPGAVDSLKVELQAVESHLMWVLGTKLRSIRRAKCSHL